MSRDAYLDPMGYEVDVVRCDYCPAPQAESRWSLYAARDWVAAGWDVDPRPGRDRFPDCAADAAGARVDVRVPADAEVTS